MSILLFCLGWAICVVYVYGTGLGHFTRVYPDATHWKGCLILALGGPFSVIGVVLVCGTRDFRLIPPSREERFKHFRRMYPTLDEKFFEE